MTHHRHSLVSLLEWKECEHYTADSEEYVEAQLAEYTHEEVSKHLETCRVHVRPLLRRHLAKLSGAVLEPEDQVRSVGTEETKTEAARERNENVVQEVGRHPHTVARATFGPNVAVYYEVNSATREDQ